MILVLSVLAFVLAVLGVVNLVRGELLWGIVLLVLACAVGPGGWAIWR